MPTQLQIQFSMPFSLPDDRERADINRIDTLYGLMIDALPAGVALDTQAKETLRGRRPRVLGNVSDDVEISEDTFQQLWDVLLDNAPDYTSGVVMVVGSKPNYLLKLKRDPRAVIKKRFYDTPHDLMYGVRLYEA
jgi:hypothetical protein